MYSCTHWLRPRNNPPPPFPTRLGSYTRALLVSQDRRHLFVTPWFTVSAAAFRKHSIFPDIRMKSGQTKQWINSHRRRRPEQRLHRRGRSRPSSVPRQWAPSGPCPPAQPQPWPPEGNRSISDSIKVSTFQGTKYLEDIYSMYMRSSCMGGYRVWLLMKMLQQQVRVRSQHQPTQWNLGQMKKNRSSVEYIPVHTKTKPIRYRTAVTVNTEKKKNLFSILISNILPD